MKVQAIRDGFDGRELRGEGEVFDWPGLEACPKWCRPLNADKLEDGGGDGAPVAAGEPDGAVEALSDGTPLASFSKREEIRDYGEAVFGASPTWGAKDAMLAELVEMDRAAQGGE